MVLGILILVVVVYGYGTWSLTFREENRLRTCENGVLRNMSWTRWEELTGGRIKLLDEDLYDSYSLSNVLRLMKSQKMSGLVGHAWEGRKMPTGVWQENPKKTLDGRCMHEWEENSKRILEQQDGRVWTGFIWLRMEFSVVLLRARESFGFHKLQGIP